MLKQMLMSCSAALLIASVGCDVDQTSEGRLPDVDVDVEPGALPEYDVETPNVDVSVKEKTVEVPDIDVEMKETEVEVPDVDIEIPEE